ncbi:MAG: ATP-binding cassette domain-containing protein [Planctomycetota bacterium]|nr:MAG: ATP-binding cassette domain-containing protein [Planctomycetota bacterium]
MAECPGGSSARAAARPARRTAPRTADDAPPVVLRARGLRKRYGDLEAVAGIDFSVRRGECFGMLGPNGAGKSTTMRMIYRASPIDEGSLEILGLEAAGGHNDRAIKRRIGVVPQEDSLDQELTVRENLEVFARFYGLRGETGRARAEALLAFVKLRDKAEVRVGALSGGMRRRLMVARGLLSEPELLVLDEPTTGLDPQARQGLWERLRALRRGGTTLLLTTHYMDEAEQLCDRLVIMDRGRIVAEGAPRALIAAHLPPHVIELHMDTAGALPEAVAALGDAIERSELLSDRILLYLHDPDAVLSQLAHALPEAEVLVRRSTLEDVFLKLTGRRLEEG